MNRFHAKFVMIVLIALLSFPAALAGTREVRVLMLGDSLTSGLGVMPDQAWPALVQKMLDQALQDRAGHPRVRVVNGGISGSTSASAVSRLNWYMKAPPDIMVMALGANDGLRGLSVDRMQKNLDDAITLAEEAGIRVVLAGIQVPPNLGPDYTAAFGQVFPDLAAAHGIPLIPFLLDGVAGRPDLNQADGIHPNARGHQIIAQTVFPYVMEALDAGT